MLVMKPRIIRKGLWDRSSNVLCLSALTPQALHQADKEFSQAFKRKKSEEGFSSNSSYYIFSASRFLLLGMSGEMRTLLFDLTEYSNKTTLKYS